MTKYLMLFVLVSAHFVSAQDVVLNEIMSSNQSTIYDEDGDATDWIELYNAGTAAVNLEGYSLSDDTLETQKWQFGSAVIQPGEYLLVFASDKNRQTDYWHTNFKVSADGESVVLSDASGDIIDRVDVPAADSDISYGRENDGALPWVFQSPSPGENNTGTTFEGYADPVTVSQPGGFYGSSVSVELSAGDSQIFYTLDGSVPDATDMEYSSPISLQETTVLRAISLKQNHLPSPILTQTYLIKEEIDLPVVSLTSDPYNLFDYNYGIYADGPGWAPPAPYRGANFFMDWERPAHVEFFDENKNLGFAQNCGIAIYGGWTRSFPQKSMSIKFKNDYDASAIEYPLFPGFDVTTFKSFILRNSGNDFDYTHIRDAFMQTLIKDLDIDYLEYRPAVTFINGEYWGIYNIREKISEHYIANRHGVDPDNIDMLEENMEVIHGDSLHYQQLVDFMSTQDMATDEAYNFINKMIDLDECILYFAAHAYFNSQDWPGVNIKYWRERSETGKWRWILFDVDFGFNLYEENGQAENHIEFMLSPVETRYSNPPWATLLPRKLVENPRIRNMFINQIADLLNTNFQSDRVIGILDEMAGHIANDIGRHRRHWTISEQTADYHINTRMKSFAQDRPGYLRDFVRDYFEAGLDGLITLNSTEGGKVKLNTLYFEPDDLPWSGVYFQGNEVQLKAIPAPGYRFDGWSGAITSEDATVSLSITRSTRVTASFSPDTRVAKEVVINEINYNSSDTFVTGDWVELYNRSDEAIDLSDWIFSDSETDHIFTIPTGTTLEPDQYLVLVEDDSAFSSRFPEITNFISGMDFGLRGTGELIRLMDEEGVLIDSLTYDDESPWPTAAAGLGATLELTDPASDNARAENWLASGGNGSPGKINTVVSSVDEIENEKLPERFALYQNYPNPFNPATQIKYEIPNAAEVTLHIYNVLGEKVKTLVKTKQKAGSHTVTWHGDNENGNTVASGIYIYHLSVGKQVLSRKLLLLR